MSFLKRNSFIQGYFSISIALMLLICFITSCQKPTVPAFTFVDEKKIGDDNFEAVYFINDSTGYVAGGKKYNNGKLLKTTNAGTTWDSIDIKTHKILSDIAFKENDEGFIAAHGNKLVSNWSSNKNWQLYQLNTGVRWKPLRAIHFSGHNGIICGGSGYNYGIIVKSNDNFASNQIDTFDFELRSVFMTSDSVAYVAGFGAILKTTDFGNTWNHLDVEGDFYTDLYFTNQTDGYAVGQQGSILKTTNAGKNWQYVRKANTLAQKRVNFNAVYFKDDLNGYIAGNKGTLWISRNAGLDWEHHNLESNTDFKAVFAFDNLVFIVGNNGSIVRVTE